MKINPEGLPVISKPSIRDVIIQRIIDFITK